MKYFPAVLPVVAALLLATVAIAAPPARPSPIEALKQREKIRQLYAQNDSIKDYSLKDLAPFDGMVKIVADPQDGFLAKVLAIRNARFTIDCSYYIFTRDRVGYALLDELKEALKRGVSVRLLVDAMGSPHPFHGELKALQDVTGGFVRDEQGRLTTQRAKADVVLFNPLINLHASVKRWYARARRLATGVNDASADMAYFRNRRSHDKILAVDAAYPELAVVMIGGRNISEAYYGIPALTSHTYNDLEVIVKPIHGEQTSLLGDAVTAYFDKLYFHLGNKFLSTRVIPKKLGMYASQQSRMDAAETELFRPGTKVEDKLEKLQREHYLDTGFDQISVSFVNEIENISRQDAMSTPEEPANKLNGESIIAHINALMKSAVSTIDIISPYVYLYPEDVRMLQNWLDADPHRKLRIVSNSVMTADNLPAQALIDNVLGPSFMKNPRWSNARGQAKVYAFGRLDGSGHGNEFGKLHAKFFLVDGKYAVVGTSNGDPRSRYLNSEVGFVLQGGEPVAELQAKADDLVNRSYLWGSPEWQALRHAKGNYWKVPVVQFIYEFIKVFHMTPVL